MQTQCAYNATQVWLVDRMQCILMHTVISDTHFPFTWRCECHFLDTWEGEKKSVLICMFVYVWERDNEDYNVTVSESFNPWLRNSWLYRELKLSSCLSLEGVLRKTETLRDTRGENTQKDTSHNIKTTDRWGDYSFSVLPVRQRGVYLVAIEQSVL